jgi:hypothetical protein
MVIQNIRKDRKDKNNNKTDMKQIERRMSDEIHGNKKPLKHNLKVQNRETGRTKKSDMRARGLFYYFFKYYEIQILAF